jgi:hypothetical protein
MWLRKGLGRPYSRSKGGACCLSTLLLNHIAPPLWLASYSTLPYLHCKMYVSVMFWRKLEWDSNKFSFLLCWWIDVTPQRDALMTHGEWKMKQIFLALYHYLVWKWLLCDCLHILITFWLIITLLGIICIATLSHLIITVIWKTCYGHLWLQRIYFMLVISLILSAVVLLDCGVKGYLSHWYFNLFDDDCFNWNSCECAASVLGTLVSVQCVSVPQFCKHFLLPVASVAQLEMSCQF